MSVNIITKINQNYTTFSKRQKLIADFVLKDFSLAANMTAAKLAETVGVSESTVVRFATELNYPGYPEFVNAISEYMRSESSILKRVESMSTAIENKDTLDTVIDSDIDNLKKSISKIDKEQFSRAVDAVLNAKKIYILGVRSSACLASFASFYFNMLFDNIRLVNTNSVSEMFEQILRVDENSLVFGISFPRYSKRTVKAMEFSKSRNATVVALTDSEKSPIAPFADYLITANSEMVSFVDSLVAPFSVLNAFIVELVMRKKGELVNNFEQLEKIWEEYQVYDKLDEVNNPDNNNII